MTKTIRKKLQEVKQEIKEAKTFEELSLIAEKRSSIRDNGEEAIQYYIEFFKNDSDINTVAGKLIDDENNEYVDFHITVEFNKEDTIFINRLLKTLENANFEEYICDETKAILKEALYNLKFKKAVLEII